MQNKYNNKYNISFIGETVTELLSKKEKQRILKTLETDEEFRYAIAGLIGLNIIISELKKLREDFAKHIEMEEKRWEENEKRWEKNEKKWQETFKILEEHRKRLEEHSRILEGYGKRLEEHSRILEEHGKRLEELTKVVGELKVAIGSLGRRWGIDLEKTVLELYKHSLKERGIELGRIEKFTYKDIDGRYYRRGAKIEVDVYAHDEKTYLIEVKSHAELEDVEWFFEKANIVEKILGKKVDKLIIVTVNIDKEALERAKELGIDTVYGAIISLPSEE